LGGRSAPPAINNFAQLDLTLLTGDTLAVCPQGDAQLFVDTLKVGLLVRGSNSSPTAGADAGLLELHTEHGNGHFCQGDVTVAVSDTDANGYTMFMVPEIGGHGEAMLIAGVSGLPLLNTDTVTVFIRSPDFNGNGEVDILDWDAFGLAYLAECGDPNYNPFFDFDGSCKIMSPDFTCFGNHWQHGCAGGGQASSSSLVLSSGSIDLIIEEDRPLQGPRKLRAEVWLNNVETYRSLFAIISNENPILRFSTWHPDPNYDHPTVAAAIDQRTGSPEIAIGVVGGRDVAARNVYLGYIEMDVLSTDPLEIAERDFGLVDARLLEIDGTTRGFTASQASLTQQPTRIVDALAQNYPNPFNPTTTISYSIADPSHVQLSVYNVRGQLVKTLVDEDQGPNVYRRIWDGRNSSGDSVASGIYFYRLIAGDFKATRKMVLIR
jgi:hypothetical protein